MIIESLRIANFRCFGPDETALAFADAVTTFVGGNGSGKTAALSALARLFGVSRNQRAVVKSDFHVPMDAAELASGTTLSIEVILAFPELEDDDDDSGAVAEFWRQMAASEADAPLKVRMRLQAKWSDDGTPDGNVEEDMRWITQLGDDFDWEACQKVSASDRAAVQMIYIPAVRNAADQVRALLRGRLWRAALWSDDLADIVTKHTTKIQKQFSDEKPIMIACGRAFSPC